MKRLITLLLLVAVVFVTLSASPQTKPAAWEYKVLVGKCWDEKKLNPLGAEGWELTTYTTWGTSAGAVDTCVFKRARPQDRYAYIERDREAITKALT